RGSLELLPRGHQRRAIPQRPAVILDMSDLDATGVQVDRHGDEIFEVAQVLAVHDQIDGEGQTGGTDQARDLKLLCVAAPESTDAVASARLAVLKAQLHMVEPGIDQPRDPSFV